MAVILRVVLGCWFVYSGGVKIFGSGLDRFTFDIANYKIVGPPLDALIAYSLPWAEVFGGVCLMLGLLRRGAIALIACLVAAFAIATRPCGSTTTTPAPRLESTASSLALASASSRVLAATSRSRLSGVRKLSARGTTGISAMTVPQEITAVNSFTTPSKR